MWGPEMNADLAKEVFAQGLDYLRKNRIPEAANAFRRAFKMDSENPRHLSYYGLILALGDENVQDAINFCRGAIVRATEISTVDSRRSPSSRPRLSERPVVADDRIDQPGPSAGCLLASRQ